MTSTTVPKPDRSAAVKEAIRESARRLFAEKGYESTGIRDIAADAEVNPAIVIRHFGSKEQLFLTAIDGLAVWRALLDGPLDQLGRSAVRTVLRGRKNGLQIFGAMVRASDRPDIHDRLQSSVVALFAAPLTERIEGADSRLRAHLFAAQLVGLMSALAVYDDGFLIDAPAEQIVEHYGGSLQRMLTGPPAGH